MTIVRMTSDVNHVDCKTVTSELICSKKFNRLVSFIFHSYEEFFVQRFHISHHPCFKLRWGNACPMPKNSKWINKKNIKKNLVLYRKRKICRQAPNRFKWFIKTVSLSTDVALIPLTHHFKIQ